MLLAIKKKKTNQRLRTAFEALLVPLLAASHAFLGSVDRLLALGTLGNLRRGERHLFDVFLYDTSRTENMVIISHEPFKDTSPPHHV